MALISINEINKEIGTLPTISKKYLLSKIQMANELHAKHMNDTGHIINIGKVYKPQEVKKYDIITAMICGSPHPCVVYKVDEEKCYSISLTTTEANHNIHKIAHSRFYEGAYFTNTIVPLDITTALERFVGVFDNKKEADVAFAKVASFYKNIFKQL